MLLWDGEQTSFIFMLVERAIVMLLPNVLTLNEWIVLIRQDSEQAKQHVDWLRTRSKEDVLLLEPGVMQSIEKYDQAQQLITSAVHDTEKTAQLASRIALGRATLGRYP